jgi:hypothetical protein
MRHSIGGVARVDEKGRGARIWMVLREKKKNKDMSFLSRGFEHTSYTHTNATHDTHTLHLLPVLFRYHILVDRV